MARASRTPNPDAQIAELHEKRLELAKRRDAHLTAQGAAERTIEGAPDRRAAALVAEARGETPSPTVEQLDSERRAAEVAVVDNRERAAALKTVEAEVGEEVDAIIDAHPQHFMAKAEAASEAAAEAIMAALNATQAAVSAWMGTREAWSDVRMSRRRRGLELGPEIPTSDLGTAVNELSKSHSRPFPGGSKAAWERFLAHESAQRNAPKFERA